MSNNSDQDSLYARIEGDDGEECGDEQNGPGGDGVGRPEERRPRHHHEQRRRHIDPQQVVPVAPREGHGGAQAGIVAWGGKPAVKMDRPIFLCPDDNEDEDYNDIKIWVSKFFSKILSNMSMKAI